MEALKRLENWERENFENLEELGTRAHVNFERAFRFALQTVNLGLFVAYFTLRAMIRVALLLFRTPRLIQLVGPEERPLERHEFERINDLRMFR